MSDKLVLVDIEEKVAVLTMNRPEKRNALSPALVTALREALVAADEDPEVTSIILTGAGDKAFCAGGDLGPPSGDGFLATHHARGEFAELVKTLTSLGKPIVGAAQGHALAGGFGLLMACDFVILRDDARYGTPEIKRGLFPMMILSVLMRVFGRRRCLELTLTGREVDAATLVSWGAANDAVPAADVMPRAKALAGELAALSPAILRLGRQAFYAAEDMALGQQLDYLHGQLTLNTMAEDAMEGIAAFFGKRAPEWKGK